MSVVLYGGFGSIGNSVNNNTMFLRSPSYISIDVEPNLDSSFHKKLMSVKGKLKKLSRERDVNLLHEFGWVDGVVHALESDAKHGIDVRGVSIRREVLGSNACAVLPAKSFYYFLSKAYRDPTILILLACASLSAGFGITNHCDGLTKGWYEGIIKLLGVILVATVYAGSDFWPHTLLHDWLSEDTYNKKIEVYVKRNGQRQKISISEIVVGDVVFLNRNDRVPADGLLLGMQTLQLDHESHLTGESEPRKIDPSSYPFLISGTRVLDGYGRMLVTVAGCNTRREDSLLPTTHTQLQKLTSLIGKAGKAVAFLVLLVSFVRYFTGNIHSDETNKTQNLFVAALGILATPLMIASTAVPDGVILAFAISLVYSVKRIMDHGPVVRDLLFRGPTRAVTTICASKTGILTADRMNVTKFWVGLNSIEDTYHLIAPNVIELLQVGIGLNLNSPTETETEKVIFDWAIQQLGMDTQALIHNWRICKIEAFKSKKRSPFFIGPFSSGIFVRRKGDNTIYVHRKGAPEMILANCSSYYESNGDIKLITDIARLRLERILKGMVAIGLRCIAFAYMQLPDNACPDEYMDEVLKTDEWTLVGLVGLQNPCAPGVKEAVRSCFMADLDVKMITGDNILTARAIAAECGILEADQPGAVVEGAEFENYTPDERLKKVNSIRVMARASHFQKFLMVQCLQGTGQSVAFVGNDGRDRMALRESDMGLWLRNHRTHTAEHSSDIVVTDGHFSSAVTALLVWDRGMLENIQIFIQFQLTATIVSVVIDSLTAMSSGDPPTIDFVASLSSGKVPYPALQLLWVKLIMGPLAAMALILEQSLEELIRKKPRQRTHSIVSYITWRNISVQVVYQITILLTIHFKGKLIFNANSEVKSTLIFNVFVLCQVFNILSARFVVKNSFKDIQRKKLFGGLIALIIFVQVVIVEFLKSFANTTRLDWGQWCSCISIASGSWLIGGLVNHLPSRKEPFFSYHKKNEMKFKTV